MHIVFDPEFAAGAWPGPPRGRAASAGEDWVGAERFAQILEVLLGLAPTTMSAGERAALLVPTVSTRDGFWSASATLDPFGTARRLLDWRDQLGMAGWTGEAAEPRLRALADITASAAPGLPERLRNILAALAQRSAGIERLSLLAPPSEFELAWQQVFAALQKDGTVLDAMPLPTADAKGDLAAARSEGFAPVGDASLVLLRPPGPLHAADEVAAWLASLGPEVLGRTVVVGAQPVLDGALHRYGLPTLGAVYAQADSAMLQLLPLVLDMAWQPQDPQRAFELLSLKPSPVPAEVAFELQRALRDWPAVGSDVWNERLEDGLSAILDPERQQRARERMALLWTPRVARGESYPAQAAQERVELLRDWLGGFMQSASAPPDASAALAQCRVFAALLAGSGLQALTHAQLLRMVDEATRSVSTPPVHDARAGVAHVGAAGGIAGPADVIVWWDFNASTVARADRLPLTRKERADLESRGVQLPATASLAAARAARWQRPLLQAARALVLVCPLRDEAGEDQHVHPLYDEIMARVPTEHADRRARLALLERASFSGLVPRTRRAPLALPSAQRQWRVPPGKVLRRESESPSSVETLLGCSLKWVLDYPGRLRASDPPQVDAIDDPRLLGRLLHRLLEQLFRHEAPGREQVAGRAGALFDEQGPRLAAALWLPGHESRRAQTRRALVRTAELLAGFLHQSGTSVLASEQTVSGMAFETAFSGKPDLIIGPPARILDLKWGGAQHRRDSLANGTAIQLAAYSYLTRERDAFPPVAYLIMSAQRLFATDAKAFPGAEPVPGPSPEATWNVLTESHKAAWAHVARGELVATGIESGDAQVPKGAQVIDGQLVLAPPCRFCMYQGLCGLGAAEVDA